MALGNGSRIQLTYGAGDQYTDIFEKKSKHYTGLGSVVAWVNITKNGYKNDFAPNVLSVKSGIFGTKIKILKKK